jgi:hypothetical protein
MKRVLTILAVLLLPLSVWAMTPIADSDLSNVTGQAGVNINANVTMDINIGTMAWGDADGIKGVYNPQDVNNLTTGGGYVGVSNFAITNLTIKARTEGNDNYNGYSTLFLKPITIDVATVNPTGSAIQVTTDGLITENMAPGTTFVRFGLGALQINMDAMSFDVGLGPRLTGEGATVGTTAIPTTQNGLLTQNLGQVSLGAMAMYINPWSYVDIFSAAGSGATLNTALSGVDFAVNVTIDKFTMSYMSWGDTDGLAGGNIYTNTSNGTTTTTWIGSNGVGAGYVGLSSFMINGPIWINGQVQIDVTNVTSGVYAALPLYMNTLLGQANALVAGLVGAAWAPAQVSNMFGAGYNGLYAGMLLAYLHATGNDALSAVYMNGLGANGTPTLAGLEASLIAQGVSAANVQADVTAALTAGAASYNPAIGTPTAVVHFSFPENFIVDIQGAISANVAVDSTMSLNSTNVGTLGDIYLQGLKFTVLKSSWVDIWAH